MAFRRTASGLSGAGAAAAGTAAAASASSSSGTVPGTTPLRRRPALEVFYDGGCKMCRYEIRHCQLWDAGRDAIVFRDITDPGFDAMVSAGTTPLELRRYIHARVLKVGDAKMGRVVSGVEVFRRMYYHLGRDADYCPPNPHIAPKLLSYVFAVTEVPVISHLADLVYRGWARFRIWNRNRTLDKEDVAFATKGDGSPETVANGKASPTCNNGSCRL